MVIQWQTITAHSPLFASCPSFVNTESLLCQVATNSKKTTSLQRTFSFLYINTMYGDLATLCLQVKCQHFQMIKLNPYTHESIQLLYLTHYCFISQIPI